MWPTRATQAARRYFTGYPPSSPSIGLLRDGKLVFFLERHQIEGRTAEEIAGDLTRAFDRYCTAGAGAACGGGGASGALAPPGAALFSMILLSSPRSSQTPRHVGQ